MYEYDPVVLKPPMNPPELGCQLLQLGLVVIKTFNHNTIMIKGKGADVVQQIRYCYTEVVTNI